VYLVKKKLAPRSVIGRDNGNDILTGLRGDVSELDPEVVPVFCENIGEFDVVDIEFGLESPICRALRMIRSDSSRNLTSSRFR